MFMLFVAAGMGLMALAHMAPVPFLLDALARGRSHWDMPPAEGVILRGSGRRLHFLGAVTGCAVR